MHPVVFSLEWFEKHQPLLLRLLALPVVGRLLRRILAIRPHDVGYRGRIVQLLPHCYTIANDDGTFTSDFRTHHKFAKRLFYGLLPVWRLLHWWDTVVANALVPALNVGFDTLTTYPDASINNVTVDGHIGYGWLGAVAQFDNTVDMVFSTLRGQATGSGANYSQGNCIGVSSNTTTDQFRGIMRGYMTFDTSVLGTQAQVINATLSLYTGQDQPASTGLGSGDSMHVVASTQASNSDLVVADFPAVGSTSFGAKALNTWTPSGFSIPGGYNDLALNSSGLAAVSLTGITKLALRMGWDLNNSFTGTWASTTESGTVWTSADSGTGTAEDPKLVVTYEVPSRLVPPNRLRPRAFAPGLAR